MSDEEPGHEEPGHSALARVSPGPAGAAMREARRELVATMLLTKTTYRDMAPIIGQRLGIETSRSVISDDVRVIRRRWRERMTEAYDDHVAEQMAYLDGALRGVATKALAGNHNAVQDLLGILDRRGRLLGLDQPEKHLFAGVVAHSSAEAWDAAPDDVKITRAQEIAQIFEEAGILVAPSSNGASSNEHDADVIDL